MDELRLGGVPASALVRRWGSPLHVLEADVVMERMTRLRDAFPGFHLLFAAKANPDRELWRLLRGAGCGLDCCSPGEVELAMAAGFAPEEISFMGTALDDEDMAALAAAGVSVHLDSLSQLAAWARHAPRGSAVGLRIDPGVGAGSHASCTTAGPGAKLGVLPGELSCLPELLERTGLRLTALHAHIGSGSFELAPFLRAADCLFRLAEDLPTVTALNFGGGLGVPHGPEDPAFDAEGYGRALLDRAEAFAARTGRRLDLAIEPGQFLVCEAGWLLMRVMVVKTRAEGRVVITDSSFNHYLGTALYQSWHDVVPVKDPDAPPAGPAELWGHLCNTGDRFVRSRPMPELAEGDLIAMKNAGAYGMSRAATYNARPLPAVVMARGGRARCIRRRQTVDELWTQQRDDPWISADELLGPERDDPRTSVDEFCTARRDDPWTSADELLGPERDDPRFSVDEFCTARRDEPGTSVDEFCTARRDDSKISFDGKARRS